MDLNTKEKFIEIFKANGFGCFPLPKYADSVPNQDQKAADRRYAAAKTDLNQTITKNDNYGVIAIKDAGTCWIDFDHKELFREFVENLVKSRGIMLIESPNGWHIPVKGIAGEIKMPKLYQTESNTGGKAAIEIFNDKHFVVGCGSDVFNEKANPPRRMFYESKGTDKIYDVNGGYFDDLIDGLVMKLKLFYATKDQNNTKGHYALRKRFREGKPPTVGTSNDYFYDAAIQCLTDEISLEEATEKIKSMYDIWTPKTRAWSNILAKLTDAYVNGKPIKPSGGRPKKSEDELDAHKIAKNILKERKIYSDVETKTILENKNGYLENITEKILKELGHDLETQHLVTDSFFREVKLKLVSRAEDIPPTNDDLKVFDNGIWDDKNKILLSKKTDEIASMGFKGYNYLEPTVKNTPTKFMRLLFDNVPDYEIPRVKAALKAALTPKLDSRMSVIHGRSRVGKSAAMTILVRVLNRNSDYAMIVELSQMNDHFIKAHIIGKTLLVLSELPKNIKDWGALKALTGESEKTERGFHKDSETFTNMIKIIATTNNIPKVPDIEKNAFYSARLSLIHNTRIEPYEHTEDFEKDIVDEEGEKIISWIVNMPDIECKYESKHTVQKEWEGLSNPIVDYLIKNYTFDGGDTSKIPIASIKRDFESKMQTSILIDELEEALKEQGYSVWKAVVSLIQRIPQEEIPKEQKTI